MITEQDREMVRRAKKLYEEQLKSELEKTHLNSFVAIEPDSGDYFLGDTMSDAAGAARDAHPGRRTYVVRVGHEAALHIGGTL